MLAGPGSGKTTVTVKRFKNLIERGVAPEDILSLTFTSEAAGEMAKRAGVDDVFRTFHSFVLEIMQKERDKLPYELKPAILPWEFEDFDLRKKLVQRYPLVRKEDALREYISTQKREGRSPGEALEAERGTGEAFARAYRDYEKQSRKEGWLDFDSLMVEAVELLTTNQEVRERYAKKYIQVDEAQDTDQIQLRLLGLLFRGNIFFVGDDNQAIYEWRGAGSEVTKNIPKAFPGAKIMYLGTNYRCHPPGTMVAVCTKRRGCRVSSVVEYKPIESIKDDERLVTWSKREDRYFIGGKKCIKTENSFSGELIRVKTESHSVDVTPNHRMIVRIPSTAVIGKYVVYLMWKEGYGFRIGQCSFVSTTQWDQLRKNGKVKKRAFRLWHRINSQAPDKVWLLSVNNSLKESKVMEEVYSAKYGITQVEFVLSNDNSFWTNEELKKIFESIPEDGGFRCLKVSGLLFDSPFYASSEENVRINSGFRRVAACNLIPGIMEMPVVKGSWSQASGNGSRFTKDWKEFVIKTERVPYSGPVYSLSVDDEHTYVANGMVVGNSTGAIVEFIKEITPVDNGLASHMRTDNPYGVKPDFTHYADDYQEAAHVLKRVTDHPRTAIIARTNRQLFRYQQACFSAGIKCKILGKKAFWEQNEVKQLLSLAKSAKMPASYTAPMILKALVIQHRLLEKYKFSGNPLDADPADNINSLYKMSAKYATIPEFLDFIRRLTYGSKSNNTPCLTLSTIHQAKGREWDHVFVTGVTEGILPHSKALHTEEKRGWFVAASRAAKTLHVTCYRNPSMFLNDYADRIVKFKPEAANGVPIQQGQ